MRRWTLSLFVALAILHLAPIWSVRYLPTGDGPTHIYNAWVLHGLIVGDAPPHIERAYRIDWRPHPNWSGHALMALAIAIVPPLAAEKMLVTLIVALTLAGTWLLATSVDRRNDVYAFLAFPFTWTQTLVAGYYNFSLSVGLYLIILAVWWRRGSVILLAALLVLCNFTHPMATLLACGSIVLLSLLLRRYRHLLALIPVIPLLALFGTTSESNVGEPLQLQVTWDAARILAKIDMMYAFDDRIRPIAVITALLYVALTIYTLMHERRREANAIGILALALIAMMFWIPAAQGTRDLFTGRMPAFVFLILPAWFSPRIAGRWRAALLAIASLLAIANAALTFDRVRHFGREMETLVGRFAPIERGTTLLPLFFDRTYAHSFVNVFAHVMSYVALDKELVDLSNYEPSTNYFPIAWRASDPGPHSVENAPGLVDLMRPSVSADYVVTLRMPHDAPNRTALRTFYRLVHVSDAFEIHRRQAPLAGPYELVLLPLLGTAGATRWEVDQTLRNRDSRPMRVVLHPCPNDVWCDRELAPGEVARIATAERRFAFLDVPKGRDGLLDINTIVRSADRPESAIVIPTAPTREFTAGGARIANIPTVSRKIGVRVYAFGRNPSHDVLLRVRSSDNGSLIAERKYSLENFGMWENAELRTETGDAVLPATVDVELIASMDARIWSFVTVTGEDGRTTVLRSRAHASGRGGSSADHRSGTDRGDVHDVLRDRR